MGKTRIVQNTFTAGEITPSAWARRDLAKYNSGCKKIVNGVVRVHGGISFRPGTVFVDEVTVPGKMIPFVYSITQTYMLLFLNKVIRIYKDGGVVLDPETELPVEIVSPYLQKDLSGLRFCQRADTLFLVHPLYPPQILTRQDHHEWTFSVMEFMPETDSPTDLTATQSGFSGTATNNLEYVVSAVNENEVESIPSASAEVTIPVTWIEGAKVALAWDAVEGATRYEVYKNKRGWFGWVGSASSNSFTDDNIEPEDSQGPKENRNPFDGENNYPGAVGIFQQRLMFARTNNEPQTVWCSQSGSFHSFAVSSPMRDDDAITATADSLQMNEIRHFATLRDLVLMTSGSEFVMKSQAAGSSAITPSNIGFMPQSRYGCSSVAPVVIGDSLIMVLNSGHAVHDLYYSLADNDGYKGTDVSILGEHLIDSPIVDWAYQQYPYSTAWVILESGKLLTFTYMREQEVWAWSGHESDGSYVSVGSVREGREDAIYFLVLRNRKDENGADVSFYAVEYQTGWANGDESSAGWKRGGSVKDAVFLECSLIYEGEPTSHITGMTHLAGRTVSVLADGSVFKGITVGLDGEFDIPVVAAKVVAGLPYEMLIETLDPEIKTETGSSFGIKKSVHRVGLQLRETGGIEVGPSVDYLTTLKLPMPELYGEPPPLYTGFIGSVVSGNNREEASVVIRHTSPIPADILGVSIEVSLEG